MNRIRVVGGVLAWTCVACAVEDVDDGGVHDAQELRVGEAECLKPTAPTAADPLVATLGPGDLVAYAGHYFTVPGAPPDLDSVIDDPQSVVTLGIGDVVRVVNGQSSMRFKAIALTPNGNLALVNANQAQVPWYHVQTLEECLAAVQRELSDCVEETYDFACCGQQAEGYEALCAADPEFFVPNNTDEIWADLCELDLPPFGWEFDDARTVEVGSLDCTFTGWVEGAGANAAVDISNGFLTGCVQTQSTPLGCQTF